MRTTIQKLTEWAISKIKKEYSDDVALLISVKGATVNGDGHGECFDYFVPSNDKGKKLGQTFIVEGIGHDLYPRTWERTENTANLEDRCTLCLGNAEILYSRTEEDKARFIELKQRLYDNLKNKEFMYKQSLKQLDIAMDLYRTMMFEDALYKVRMAAGYVTDYLSNAIAYLNGTFIYEWKDNKCTSIFDLEDMPDSFIEYYNGIINARTAEELKNLAHLIIYASRQFIAKHKPYNEQKKTNSNFADLSDWYQELSLKWRHLSYHCEVNDKIEAFSAACYLQNELNIVKEEFGLAEMNLLGCFDSENLFVVKEQGLKLEKYIISEIESHGIKINKYNTVEEFLADN